LAVNLEMGEKKPRRRPSPINSPSRPLSRFRASGRHIADYPERKTKRRTIECPRAVFGGLYKGEWYNFRGFRLNYRRKGVTKQARERFLSED